MTSKLPSFNARQVISILMRRGFPPIAIAYRRRAEYYAAIRAAVKGNLKPFVRLLCRYLSETKMV